MPVSKRIQLYSATLNDDAGAVERLLLAGANPNIPLSLDECIASIDMALVNRGESATMEWDDQTLQLYRNGDRPEERRGFYPLFNAFNNVSVLKLLLAAGAYVDVRDALTGNTPLHQLAVQFYLYDHSFEAVPLLLDAGAPLETWNNEGWTPLQAACWRKSDGSLLAALLARGASVHARDRDGNAALHAAGYWDEGYLPWRKDSRDEFCSGSDDQQEEFEPLSLLWGAREAVNALVDAGADPNAVNPYNGYTAMHWASVHHGQPYLEFLESLFERGGEVCIPDRKGRLPLDMYVDSDGGHGEGLLRRFTGSLHLPIQLDKAPASLSTRQVLQFRLWRAVIGNHPKGVEAALADGAGVNIPITTDEIIACAHVCAGRDGPPRGAVYRTREESSGKIGVKQENYVLFRALDKPAILRILLAAGARADVCHYANGHSPLHALASSRYHRPAAAAAALLDAGADVDMLDREGRTPLQTACKYKADGALITLLLCHGASVHRRDGKGRTAMEHAMADKGNHSWIADQYPRKDSSPWIRRLFAAYEDPWARKDAARALRDAAKRQSR